MYKRQIYEAVKKIPKGHVATYGKVAELAGDAKMARAVGNALHKNPDPEQMCIRDRNQGGNAEFYSSLFRLWSGKGLFALYAMQICME